MMWVLKRTGQRVASAVGRSCLVVCLGVGLLSATPAGTQGVKEEFEAICRDVRSGSNLYFGRGTLEDLSRQLETITDPTERAATRGLLGKTHMLLGEMDEAIAVLSDTLRTVTGERLGDPLRATTLWFLALAHLQAGEDENCVLSHSASSCILPIGEGGVHRRPQHARQAADYLSRYLAIRRDDVRAAWLLNLARQVSGDFPMGVPDRFRLPAGAFRQAVATPHWEDRAPALGLAVVDLAGGAVMDDFDGDNLLDIVTSTWDPCDGLKAFRNDGRGGFEDVTEAWGLADQLGGLNLNHADYDGDGDLDLLVLRGAWMLTDGTVRN